MTSPVPLSGSRCNWTRRRHRQGRWQYGDFSLRLQFRDARTDAGFSNSGVFVRFPDPRIPLEQRPPGSWGTFGPARTSAAWVAIYCGQEVQVYDGPGGEPQKTGSIYNFLPVDLRQFLTGFVGLQNPGTSDLIELRNIRARTL